MWSFPLIFTILTGTLADYDVYSQPDTFPQYGPMDYSPYGPEPIGYPLMKPGMDNPGTPYSPYYDPSSMFPSRKIRKPPHRSRRYWPVANNYMHDPSRNLYTSGVNANRNMLGKINLFIEHHHKIEFVDTPKKNFTVATAVEKSAKPQMEIPAPQSVPIVKSNEPKIVGKPQTKIGSKKRQMIADEDEETSSKANDVKVVKNMKKFGRRRSNFKHSLSKLFK